MTIHRVRVGWGDGFDVIAASREEAAVLTVQQRSPVLSAPGDLFFATVDVGAWVGQVETRDGGTSWRFSHWSVTPLRGERIVAP